MSNAVPDIDQLSSMAIIPKEALGVDQLKVVADTGYCNAVEIQICKESGIETYIPKTNTSISTKKGRYGKEQFTDDPEKNGYTCPAGKKLPIGLRAMKSAGIKRGAYAVTPENRVRAVNENSYVLVAKIRDGSRGARKKVRLTGCRFG